jgi:dihydrodipicolinate synthase/N-acetylneuraminate lyase
MTSRDEECIMLTMSAIDLQRLTASVLAVPPLARNADLTLNRAANRRLIRHMERGVSTLLYGGNANLYHAGLAEFPRLLDMLAEDSAPGTLVIPSVGPDFGKMMDQAEILRSRAFPTVMVLPATFPTTIEGAADGISRFADRFGKPVILYIKRDDFLTPAAIAKLIESGAACLVKYGTVRAEPGNDRFLAGLVAAVDPARIISGIGERPAIVHLQKFGLAGFTSGAVCVAPCGSQAILDALRRGDVATAERLRGAYLALEDLRDAFNPIRVLHEAVTLSGIADMGPMLPLLSNLPAAHHDAVRAAARALLAFDDALAAGASAVPQALAG